MFSKESYSGLVDTYASQLQSCSQAVSFRAVADQFIAEYPDAVLSESELVASSQLFTQRLCSDYCNTGYFLFVDFLTWATSLVIDVKKIPLYADINVLTGSEIKSILGWPDLSVYKGVCDYALLLLFLNTGVKYSEAFALLLSDFDVDTNTLHIGASATGGNNSRVRTVKLIPQLQGAMCLLVKSRALLWSDRAPLFASKEGRVYPREQWHKTLKELTNAVGFNVDAERLRDTFIITSLQRGVFPFDVAKSLGLLTVDALVKYVDYVRMGYQPM